MRAMIFAVLLLVLVGIIPVDVSDQEGAARVFFLTRSQNFEHSSIAEEDGKLGHAQTAIKKLAELNGAEFTTTKDADTINAENL